MNEHNENETVPKDIPEEDLIDESSDDSLSEDAQSD